MAADFFGVAVDAGSGLGASISAARGASARDDDLTTFKKAVLETLGPGATTVLLDASEGPELLANYPSDCARMLAFEADVYHISDDDRITVLPDNLAVEDYPNLGVGLLKFFMYYAPDGPADLNAKKQDIVADLGQRCREAGVSYLMEPLVYHPDIQPGDETYARIKPDLVRRATETFSAERFHVDVLKVEIPVDLNFVEGFGQPAISREAAHHAFRQAADAAGDVDIVYLSAGVSFDQFEASLRMAREAGVDYRGFMCGRAIWSDAVAVFGAGGERALRTWLERHGADRLTRLIAATR